MANPIKFSEKIALLNQKQAEETPAFEQIMWEVSDATSKKMVYELQQQDGNDSKFPSQDVCLIEAEEKCLQPLHEVKSEPEEINEDFVKSEPNYGCTIKIEEEEEEYPLRQQSKFPSQDVCIIQAEEKCLQPVHEVKSEPKEVKEGFVKAEPNYCYITKIEEEENALYQLVPFARDQIQALEEMIKNENPANDFDKINSKGDQEFISGISNKSRRSSIHTNDVNFEPETNYNVCVANAINSCNSPVHVNTLALSCQLCGKSFNYRSNLDRHLRIHSGDRPFSCEVCGKSFNSRNTLKKHFLIHTGDRPYSCEVCGKSFNRKSDLKSHLLVHTGDRPFSCELCTKSFSHRSTLKSHLLTHTGDRPYSCDVCGKFFNHGSHFKSHLLTHTGDRPFSCEVCGKSFNRKDILKTHLLIHSVDRPFTCEVCGKCFKNSVSLKKHLLMHDNNC